MNPLKTHIFAVFFVWTYFYFSQPVQSARPIDSLDATVQHLQGLTGTLLVVPNLCSKVYITVGGTNYYYVHQPSRLFPSKHEIDHVKIDKIEFRTALPDVSGSKNNRFRPSGVSEENKPYVSVVLRHPHLKRGEIRIYREDKNPIENGEDIAQILGYAIVAPGIPKQPLFIGNRKTQTLHFAGCNYLPPKEDCETFDTLEEGVQKGYKPSSLSFTPLPLLSSYEDERLLGARTSAELRYYFPLCASDAVHQRVNEIGQRVLGKWPTTLKGYTYHFYALDTDSVNAYACPGGTVFVTTGLLDILESDEEFEAILAHEITHVERRHGLRRLRSAQVGAVVGTILSLGAAASNQENAATAVGISGLVVSVANAIALTGYSREHEIEADMAAEMYLLRNKMDARLLALALRKFKYHSDKLGLSSDRTNLFSSHPALDHRIYIAEHSQVYPFEKPWTFDGFTRDDQLAGTLKFEAEYVYTDEAGNQVHSLLGELETTTVLADEEKIKDIRILCDGRSLKLNNQDVSPIRPLDSVGVTFDIKNKKFETLKEIQSVELKLGPINHWTQREE